MISVPDGNFVEIIGIPLLESGNNIILRLGPKAKIMNELHEYASRPHPDDLGPLDPEASVRLRDSEVAAELVQEVYLQAFRDRGQFKGESSERAWLVSIRRHKLIDNLRKSGREEPTDPGGLGDGQSFDRGGHWLSMPGRWKGNPGQDMERREFWVGFEGCLSRLTSNVADAFLLRVWSGRSLGPD